MAWERTYSLSPQTIIPCFPRSGVLVPLASFYTKSYYITKFLSIVFVWSWWSWLYQVTCSWLLFSQQIPECWDKKLVYVIKVLGGVLTTASSPLVSYPSVVFQLKKTCPYLSCIHRWHVTKHSSTFCAWVFHISFATLLKLLEYSWEGMMSRWRFYLQMLIWKDTAQLSFVSVHWIWHLLSAFLLSVFLLHCWLSFRYSNKWKWRLWWLECLQPSFSLSQCFIWRALWQHGTAASSYRALQQFTATFWSASNCFKFYQSFWFDGTLSDNHDHFTKYEFLYDELQSCGRQFTHVKVTGTLLFVLFANDLPQSIFTFSLITTLKINPFHSWNPYLVTRILWLAFCKKVLSKNVWIAS